MRESAEASFGWRKKRPSAGELEFKAGLQQHCFEGLTTPYWALFTLISFLMVLLRGEKADPAKLLPTGKEKADQISRSTSF